MKRREFLNKADIKATQLKYEESHYDKDFVAAMIQKIEWPALLQAMQQLRECAQIEGAADLTQAGGIPELPAAISEADKVAETANEAFLKKLHLVLFDIHMTEGKLVCPESGREFPVEKGIPNMLLNDDEV